MDNLIEKLIDESIKVELNLSKLYSIFSKKFVEDETFWTNLSLEEKDHASLLLTAKTLSTVTNDFPFDILAENLDKVKSTNQMIEQYILISENLSNRDDACRIALKIELSSSELSYQQFMEKAPNNDLSKIFIKLNYFDKNHAKRICEYFHLIDSDC